MIRARLGSLVAPQPLPLLDAKTETSPDCVPRASEQSLLSQLNKAASSARRSCKTAISRRVVLGIDLRC